MNRVHFERFILCVRVGAAIAFLVVPGAVRTQPDPSILRMADSISIPTMQAHIQTLERAGGHHSRVNFTPGNDSAGVYLKGAFGSYPGLTSVAYDTFYIASATGGLNTRPLVNVVATLLGRREPGRIFVAGAHLDCSGSRMGASIWKAQWQTMVVPGADDNATGLAVILELARIMSDTSFGFVPDYTVQFVAFGAEESGPAYTGSHQGSGHFAEDARTAGANIAGMVSVDMIGYNPGHLYQSIITNTASLALAGAFANAVAVYAPGLVINTTNDVTATYSDHDSFWRAGFQAICLMENAPPWNSNAYYQANPFYHTSSDTSGTVNMELVRNVARMTLAAIASLASSTTGIRQGPSGVVPASLALEGNYPNPFNPSTTIRYAIPVRSHVRLSVYNSLGQKVQDLVDRDEEAGYYDVPFIGGDCAGGMYFYQLRAGRYVKTGRMILLK